MNKINKFKIIFINRVWEDNSLIVQLLGLCPLLAGSSTIINSLILGLITTFILCFSNTLISIFHYWIPSEIRIPIYIIIISFIVSTVQILINTYAPNLYQSLGIFIPLIVTNCIIIERAENYAIKNNIYKSAIDGLSMGLGITIAMFFLGAIKEILGQGTLFDHADLLLGGWAKILRIEIFKFNFPFLFAVLPPGSLIGLGLILAINFCIDKRVKKYFNKH
ncbi:Electron transport complex protein RnfE [Candidatus Arsenophonus lipoptenae]|uniref:Ion-translocating oxidoreductase complex subunit E n=1 Tax=Candidatus Arsenophonus lipoptenae TaxID=634113 RepID=A0A0X9W9U3_9GAMM|nr:Electron transport complex protein RnfE [Candidatus Arsenophonus lipoptenae]